MTLEEKIENLRQALALLDADGWEVRTSIHGRVIITRPDGSYDYRDVYSYREDRS